jgi:hypothetical protein
MKIPGTPPVITIERTAASSASGRSLSSIS